MGLKVCPIGSNALPPAWAVCGWRCRPSLVGRLCRMQPAGALFGPAAWCDISTAPAAGALCAQGLSAAAFFELRALGLAAREVVDRSDADDAVRTMFRFLRLWPFRWEAHGPQPVTEDATAPMDPPPVGGYMDFFF